MGRINFNRKSLSFRLWIYFAGFAMLLMAILWFLQIFFLNTYYQDMKIRDTARVAATIESKFGSEGFIDVIVDLSITNDIYIHIETFDGSIIFSPATEERHRPSYAYVQDMQAVRTMLQNSNEQSVSIVLPEPRTDTNILAYASFLNQSHNPFDRVILYIFSPLYPVSSTVSILSTQLAYVTVISLLLAFALSYFLSRRLTLPKDLMANVSHDLRTPLTMVKSYAEMIRDISGDVPEKRNAHLNVIIEEADRLNLLVSDMLTLSGIQSGAVPLEKSNWNIKEVIESILGAYSLHKENQGYTFFLSCDDGISVNADQAKIKQVLSNLINNAVKYCGEDKHISITVKAGNNKVRCEVADNGQGIPQNEIGQIWDRYYKGGATEGTGLGLAIVKEILTLHNAKFGVTSEPGRGSTFWFEL